MAAAVQQPGQQQPAASTDQLVAQPLVARTGRERQKYAEDGKRLVAGCIPIRRLDSGELQVLMVSSQRGDGLIFPKGGWETDETAEEAAARESLEEAGVRGELQDVGSFEFIGKTSVRKCAYVFVMNVTEELAVWPEKDLRQRVWCTVEDAITRCRHEWMRSALQQWAASQAAA